MDRMQQPPFQQIVSGETTSITIATSGVLNSMLENDTIVINGASYTLGGSYELSQFAQLGVGTPADAEYALHIADDEGHYLKLTSTDDPTLDYRMRELNQRLFVTTPRGFRILGTVDALTGGTPNSYLFSVERSNSELLLLVAEKYNMVYNRGLSINDPDISSAGTFSDNSEGYKATIYDGSASKYIKLYNGSNTHYVGETSNKLQINHSQGIQLLPSTNNTTSFQVQNTGGSTILNVDSTNKRLGINNTAPDVPLHINSNDLQDPIVRTQRGSDYWDFGMENDGDFIIRPNTGNYFDIKHSDGSNVLRIQGGQKGVSIGSASDPKHTGLDVLSDGSNAFNTTAVTINNLALVSCSGVSTVGVGNGIGLSGSGDPTAVGSAIITQREGSWSQGGMYFATKQTTTPDSTIPIRMILNKFGVLVMSNTDTFISDADIVCGTRGGIALKHRGTPATTSGYGKLYVSSTTNKLNFLDHNGANLTFSRTYASTVETTTPSAESGIGKWYTKSDNKPYFQDGSGVEHEIQTSITVDEILRMQWGLYSVSGVERAFSATSTETDMVDLNDVMFDNGVILESTVFYGIGTECTIDLSDGDQVKTIGFDITFTGSSGDLIEFYIKKGTSSLPYTERKTNIPTVSNRYATISGSTIVNMSDGDVYAIKVKNYSSTSSIFITNARFYII